MMKKRGQKERGKIAGKRAEAETDFMAYFIIAIIILAVAFIGYLILSGKGANAIEYIKNMFRNLFSGGSGGGGGAGGGF